MSAVETVFAHTERSIQDALYWKCAVKLKHRYIVPNVTMFGWESDLISVTANDFVCEYEIKISRKDFNKDLLKNRHSVLTGLRHAPIKGWLPDHRRKGAAYFYYVVPVALETPEEIPEYAGLMVVHQRGRDGVVETAKKAPRLHSDKLTDWQRTWLERSLTARYWNNRIGLPESEEKVLEG